jgi:hypothetical protein
MGSLVECGDNRGGPGATANPGGGTRAATVNLYVTDGFREDWTQVLVTLYKVEASTDGGATFTTIFANASGQSIDLASLGQAAQLLSSATVPAGTVTSVRVTLGDTVSLTAKSGGIVSTKTVDNSLPNVSVANGQAVFTFAAPTPVAEGRLSNLVVDFKLAAFELVSGKIRPALGPADPASFDGKQKIAHVDGLVSNYVAGAGFDLTPDCGQGKGNGDTPAPNAGTPSVIHVTLTGATTISAPSAPLANGSAVIVDGTPDATGAITATVVTTIDARQHGPDPDQTSPRPAQLVGVVTALGSGGTFTVALRDGEHIPHSAGAVTVQTSPQTLVYNGSETTQLASVTASSYVVVSGTFAPATGILTATIVGILPMPPPGQTWPVGYPGQAPPPPAPVTPK